MKFKKIVFFLVFSLLVLFTGCVEKSYTLEIVSKDNQTIYVGEVLDLDFTFDGDSNGYLWETNSDVVSITQDGIVCGVSAGEAVVSITIDKYSDYIIITVLEKSSSNNTEIKSDPYVDVDKEKFYENYEVATSYLDSYYRSLHGLMSGNITEQDQKPTLSEYQPKKDGKLIRNSESYYSEDMKEYTIVDSQGNEVMTIYEGGAYITLEEVAAYVLAFNDIPANYTKSKTTKPANSVWGKYLRLNHTNFTGDTKKYPYEPELPNISGCGGDYLYYELDLGTTGNDCDTNYASKIYNDGKTITRGASRIVYSRCDLNNNEIIDINERYVFYTYNHYNDFQEYLNYYGGWGEMFGNISGGGELSNKNHCNPTQYIERVLSQLN